MNRSESLQSLQSLQSLKAILGACLLAALCACGGGSNGTGPAVDTPTAPSITQQPQSQSVTVGQVATFGVTATGTAPISYQWKQGGTAIGGATNASYTTPVTAMTDTGKTYSVTVTNSAGHVDSNSATLTVSAAGSVSVSISPTQANLLPGGTQQFTSTVTGSGNSAVTWSVPEAGGGSVNGSGLYTAPAAAGTYHVVATSIADTGKSATAQITVSASTTAWNPHFAVRSDGGSYWISVDVDNSATQVWIQWNGTWRAMSKQSWGEGNGQLVFGYSKDIPDGATLALKALSTAGQTAQTQPFTFHFGTSITPVLGLSVSISPATATLKVGQTQPFTAVVTNSSNIAVTWSVQEAGGGTVSGSGLYAAPAAPGIYHVLATSVADTSLSASAEITVAPSTPPAIANLQVAKTDGCSATLTWTTGWPCNASVTCQKSGAAAMTRTRMDFVANRSFVLDLLQAATTYTVQVTVADAFGGVSAPQSISVTTTSGGVPDVIVSLDPATTRTISPYIYGINFNDGVTDTPAGVTFNRYGGNRWTAYNWENNASNAGSDYGPYSNDAYISSSTVPAEGVRAVIAKDESRNQASLVTLQLQGYVSADESGNVDVSQSLSARLAARFKPVVFKKSSQSAAAFTTTPSTADAYVYMDEFAWTLNQKLPGIFATGAALPTFIELDNEPELWHLTHLEIQGSTAISSDDYITKTLGLSKALKDQFPEVKLFGPVHFGFSGLFGWPGDAKPTPAGSDWFTDKYLLAMKAASNSYGKRLLDVYDFHWYSEARSGDGSRVSDLTAANLTDDQVQTVVQSPRSLWDPTYTETSWITTDALKAPIQILGRLQAKIDAEWPGTQIAITEYENGGDNHIAGAVAEADNLGIFADAGLFAASWWPPNSTYPYTVGAFRAYRGFDGAGANFGDTALKAVSSSIAEVSVHASLDSKASGRVVFVAINRSTSYQEVALNGQSLAGTATVYRISAESGAAQVAAGTPVAPMLAGSVPVSGSSFLIALPPLSVSTIEVK